MLNAPKMWEKPKIKMTSYPRDSQLPRSINRQLNNVTANPNEKGHP